MDLELDQICIVCFGSGEQRFSEDPCSGCDGYGRNLTPQGVALVEFLQRRGIAFPMSPKAEAELSDMVEP